MEEDLENEENEFGSVDDDSSPSDSNNYVHPSVMNMENVSLPVTLAMQTSMSSMVTPHLIAPQCLQQGI